MRLASMIAAAFTNIATEVDPVDPGIVTLTLTSASGFGDSITVGANASTAAQRWLNICASAVGASGDLLNAGISGTVLQNSNGALGTPLANNGRDRYTAAVLAANKKDGIFMAYGFNDARYVAAPATFNATAYTADLGEVIDGLIAGGFAVDKIIVLNPYYITATGLVTGTTGFTGQTRAGFEEYLTNCETVALAKGVRFVDVYSFMQDMGVDSMISTDNFHPSNNGHLAIADSVLRTTQPRRMPTITVESTVSGQVDYAIVRPFEGTVTNYTVEWCVNGNYEFNGSKTSGASGNFTGITDYSVRVRARANFDDATVGPWAYSEPVTVSGASKTFLQHTFTGAATTPVTSLTPAIGGTWRVQTGLSPATPAQINTAGDGLHSTTTSSVYQNPALPASPDYYVEAVYQASSAVTTNIGIAGRMSPTGNTYLWCRWNSASNEWQLWKTVSGTATMIAAASGTFSSGNTRTIRLTMNGANLSVSIDGTTLITATDNTIMERGFAGFRIAAAQSPTNATFLKSIIAEVV